VKNYLLLQMNSNKDSIVDELLCKDEITQKTAYKHLKFYHPGLDVNKCEEMLLEFKENLSRSFNLTPSQNIT
jgi:hypothetical protein